jgi:hypothetical protein
MGESNRTYELTVNIMDMALIKELHINLETGVTTALVDFNNVLYTVQLKDPLNIDGGTPFINAVTAKEDWEPGFNYYDGTSIINAGVPLPNRSWDWETLSWDTDLAGLKDAKWEEIKEARTAARVSPTLTTRFGIFDADTEGVTNMKDTVIGLNEAAKIGMAPEFITWTLADNTSITLTPLELAEVSALLLLRGNAAFTHARDLRELIYSPDTDTPEKVAAITW